MHLYTLKRQQLIRRSRGEVFDFFSSPENLARITPENLGFRILTPSPIAMASGSLIDYTIRVAGMRVRWTSIITAYDPPNRFVDEQLRGPYSYWHHTHRFTDTDDGTLIFDEVRYALPFWWIGRFVHRLFVRRRLVQIFEFRARMIGEILEPRSGRSGGHPNPISNPHNASEA